MCSSGGGDGGVLGMLPWPLSGGVGWCGGVGMEACVME